MMKVSEFLQDGFGSFSATRLAFLLWALGVLLVWAYTSIQKGSPSLPIDNSVIVVLGILMTGKVTQSFSPGDSPQIQAANAQAQAPQPAPAAPAGSPALTA
ncbi:hypothetical protein HA052_16705 [Chromobacterium haemolyticum]|uniref:Uncharacterized protein n=2 Tax=Chromobacteriaceae TaxID=1499392 RepID=A0ABX0L587_9NEIS|nr:hypothetical protein [Chromobacterium haemolyticum]NHR06829.1 hypothetical protein [Chromobacterium haemolyticum]OQS41509.1 hypothetical protein B0T39_08705 [Chromobacterium haemolyticum]